MTRAMASLIPSLKMQRCSPCTTSKEAQSVSSLPTTPLERSYCSVPNVHEA